MSPSSGAIFEIPTSDPLVAPAPGSTPNTPDQIHVTLGGAHSAALTAQCPPRASSHHASSRLKTESFPTVVLGMFKSRLMGSPAQGFLPITAQRSHVRHLVFVLRFRALCS